MKLTKANLNKLNSLYQKSKNCSAYKNIYKKKKLPTNIHTYDQWLELPIINRSNFYTNQIKKNTTYLAKSRPDNNGHEPILPMDNTDYHNFIHHEEEKLKIVGIKKEDRCSIVEFAMSETILMAQAFINLGTKYIVLEGSDDIIFQDIIKKRINVIFTQSRMLARMMNYFKKFPQKTSLRLVISTGEKINDLKETREQVKKVLGADFIDQIGSRETTSFAISCPSNNYYHFLEKLAFVEVIELFHQKTPTPTGELVITPYWREDLPLIRYSTGDSVERQQKKCNCKFSKESVFSGIIDKNKNSKIGNTMMPLKKMYDAATSAFYYQNKYIDYLLWKIVQQPKLILLVMKNNDTDILVFISEKQKSLWTARRKGPLERIITKLDYDSAKIAYIKVDKQTLSQLDVRNKYLDLRYVPKNKINPRLIKLLKNNEIPYTTTDE